MNPEILQTKLFIPPPMRNIVPRPWLIQELNEGLRGKLTLIPAPAGYGKTTLLSEWLAQLDRRVAWLSLDEDDNVPARFTAYLRAAVQPHMPKFEPVQSAADREPDLVGLLTRWINHLADSGEEMELVLDDYHAITRNSLHSAVMFLLDHMPQNLHLTISTRMDPPFRLPQYRARGELKELRAAELCFNMTETTAFLNECMALDLDPDEIGVLHRKTEGWITGLQLAALSLRKTTEKHAFISAFAGDDRYIADYLAGEALSRQPQHIQTFLLETSLLERLNSEICNAVTGRQDSRAILELLDRENLFLISLDHQRLWYRYHHLFADLLRTRLKQIDPNQSEIICRRASTWYENAAAYPEAVRFALLAEDYERVKRLIESNAMALLSANQLPILNRMLAALPVTTIERSPALQLAKAWGLAFSRDVLQAEALLDLLEEGTSGLSPAENLKITSRVLILRSYIAAMHGDYESTDRLARQALEMVPEEEPAIRGLAVLLLGNPTHFEGTLPDLLAEHLSGLQSSTQAGDRFLNILFLGRLVEIYQSLGKLRQALRAGLRGQELAETYQQDTGVCPVVLGFLLLRLSAIYYEMNDLERARTCLSQGFDLARQWGGYDTLTRGYLTQAKIHLAGGDTREALNKLRQFKTEYPDQSRVNYQAVSALEVEIQLRSGQKTPGIQWAGELNFPLQAEAPVTSIPIHLAYAEVLRAKGDHAAAVDLYKKLLSEAEKAGAVDLQIKVLTRISVAGQARGHLTQSLAAARDALELAEPERYRRVFLDLGAPMVEVLGQAAREEIHSDYCMELLEMFRIADHTRSSPNQALAEPLSSRELEVLSQIAQGCSNREIARKLYLALSTVKSHARSIYGKLGVKNRTEAVARARALKILSPPAGSTLNHP